MSDRDSSLAWLGTPGDARLGLGVDRYEYPANNKAGDWDANWLVIRGRVEWQDRSWSFLDPCLTTWELVRLIEWLDAFPRSSDPEIWFTEPHLSMRCMGESRLTVQLRAEALPSGLVAEDQRWEAGIVLTLPVTPASVASFAAQLRDATGRFPIR